jgi:hypothetical protein
MVGDLMEAVLERTPELLEEEIVRITGYHRAGKQLETLKFLGIPACRRRDNTVLVLRVHLLYPVGAGTPAQERPKLKPIIRKK